jgi:nitrogen fixation-related uncharacterized protein
MAYAQYIILGMVFAGFFFAAAAYALNWAHRNGQLKEFDSGAQVVFDDEEEPSGSQTDFFPAKRKRLPKTSPSNSSQTSS